MIFSLRVFRCDTENIRKNKLDFTKKKNKKLLFSERYCE